MLLFLLQTYQNTSKIPFDIQENTSKNDGADHPGVN